MEPSKSRTDLAAVLTAAGFARSSLEAISAEQERLLDAASRSPLAGIASVTLALEEALRTLAGDLGIDRFADASFTELVSRLVTRGTLTSEAASSLLSYRQIRNRVVHRLSSEEAATDAVFAGLELLYLLWVIPRPVTRAVQMVPVFLDDTGKREASDVQGVMCAILDEPSSSPRVSVFPTRRVYLPGQRLSWTWNVQLAFGRMWYRDPITGEFNKAWDRSSEFVGIQLQDPGVATPPVGVPATSLSALSSAELERLVMMILQSRGFHVQVTSVRPDEGIDFVLERDGFKWVAQVKNYPRPTGVADVRQLQSARAQSDADYALLVSTRGFTPGARDYARRTDVQLWDSANLLGRALESSPHTDEPTVAEQEEAT